jgi:hypothetical protein
VDIAIAIYSSTAVMLGLFIFYVLSLIRMSKNTVAIQPQNIDWVRQRKVNNQHTWAIAVLYVIIILCCFYYVVWIEERRAIAREVLEITRKNGQLYEQMAKEYRDVEEIKNGVKNDRIHKEK